MANMETIVFGARWEEFYALYNKNRIFNVMFCLIRHREGHKLVEPNGKPLKVRTICAELGITRQMVYRYLQVLLQDNFLHKDGKYLLIDKELIL